MPFGALFLATRAVTAASLPSAMSTTPTPVSLSAFSAAPVAPAGSVVVMPETFGTLRAAIAARSPRSGFTSVVKFTPSLARESSIILCSFGYPGKSDASLPTCVHCGPSRSVVISK